ncbi:hypothetical protein CR158_10385 [Halomonas heilongjiangensis]|uniref:CopG family transcriptional regulator n=1 Tax=Halomonas heilongjiangensis TaxID=1387883 RepID=A0A2N7TU69_9GAMM|nr:hypothetical protein C1H66_01495 [Halomonas heilongjiangensis]PXX89980.1 hypothetical protein CR158_10385 [Halomonas heilongjiangensis]
MKNRAEDIEKRERDQERWQQTLDAIESATQGEVVDASEVHDWLKSWGTDKEKDAPRSPRFRQRLI